MAFSKVAIAVRGSKSSILKFLVELQNGNMLDDEILDTFQVIKSHDGFFLVIAEYYCCANFCEDFQTFWNNFKKYACQDELSYIFYQVKKKNYVEYDSNRDAPHFNFAASYPEQTLLAMD